MRNTTEKQNLEPGNANLGTQERQPWNAGTPTLERRNANLGTWERKPRGAKNNVLLYIETREHGTRRLCSEGPRQEPGPIWP